MLVDMVVHGWCDEDGLANKQVGVKDELEEHFECGGYCRSRVHLASMGDLIRVDYVLGASSEYEAFSPNTLEV
jgi:hypothetical protein